MGNTQASFNSGKLITFDNDNKIVLSDLLQNNIDSKCVVISMIGCARVGKSTFINGFLSYLFKENIQIATTSNGGNHCTTGIDYICMDYEPNSDGKIAKIIILDCQGLSYEDSKNDDKLLSIVYTLSDIVIYHETGIVNNQTLNTLTLLCLVADYIKTDSVAQNSKPILFFRMRDYNLDCDPKEVLERTFATQFDQYDKVRGAINKLFPLIHPITTDSLGKKELAQIAKGNYLSLLEENEYNFISAYNDILQSIPQIKIKTIGSLYDTADKIINKLNTNQQISFNDYDYYTLLVQQRFSDYWKNVDHKIYSHIVATKFETTYVECTDRLKHMDAEIEKFTKTFHEVEKTLLDNEIHNFVQKIQPHIMESKNECVQLATDDVFSKMDSMLVNIYGDIFGDIYGDTFGHDLMTNNLDAQKVFTNLFVENYISKPINYIEDSNKLCKISIETVKDFVKSNFINIFDELQVCQIKQQALFNQTIKKTNELINTMGNIEYIKQQIHKINIKSLHKTNHVDYFTKIKNDIHTHIISDLDNIIIEKHSTGLELKDNVIVLLSEDTFVKKEVGFKNLIKIVNQKIFTELFENNMCCLEDHYREHLILILGKDHLSENIIQKQTLVNFAMLNLPEDPNFVKILSEITGLIFEENKYYQTTENVDGLLKYLATFIGFSYEFIIDNLLECKQMIITNKINNIQKYIVNYNSIYGKFFLDKILDNYLCDKYLVHKKLNTSG